MKKIMNRLPAMVLLLGLAGITPLHAAEKKPTVIRLGSPGAGYGKPYTSGVVGTVHTKGLLEEEFRKDGIKIEWNIFKGAGPAVNESLANNLLDVAFIGDIPIVIHKSTGLKTKLILGYSTLGNTYIVVPTDSTVTSLRDLKGKRIGIFKGTVFSLAFAKIASKYGFNAEKDFRLLNLDSASIAAALKTKDIDAGVHSIDAYALRTQGVGKIIYSSRDEPNQYKFTAGLVVTEKFAKEYPDIVKRIVKVFVQANKWNTEHKDESFKLWTNSGTPYASFKEEYKGVPIKLVTTPLIDDFYVNKFKEQVATAKEKGLIRKTFNVDDLIDRSYLDAALKELKLEHYWPRYDAGGKEIK